VSLSRLLKPQDHSTITNRLAGVIEAIDPDHHASQALVKVRCGRALLLARVTHRSLDALGLRSGSAVWCQVEWVALLS
jgi:molybdate transport system ATP-binding protein